MPGLRLPADGLARTCRGLSYGVIACAAPSLCASSKRQPVPAELVVSFPTERRVEPLPERSEAEGRERERDARTRPAATGSGIGDPRRDVQVVTLGRRAERSVHKRHVVCAKQRPATSCSLERGRDRSAPQRVAASSAKAFAVSACTAPGPRPPCSLPSAASAGRTPSASAALRSAPCSTRNFATSV
jgi:hypothetical protein